MKLTRYREFDSFSPQQGVRLLAYQSERFKTIRARVHLLEPIQPQVVTENSLLSRVMGVGTENHPTRRDIARACEELYGAAMFVGVTRYADVQSVVASVDFPADRFLPKGSKELEHALSLLTELLTRPALNDDASALRADSFEREKYQLENDLRALRDDKPSWAALQATKRIYAGTPAAIYEHGDPAELNKITAESLLTRQRSLIRNARVMAFVTGPVQPLHALSVLADKLTLPRNRRVSLPPPVKLRNHREVHRCADKGQGGQTHLVFTWSGGDVYGSPGYAPMLYADALLGGYGMNRLFKVVREEHGLAYSIGSSYHRARGSIVAQASVSPKKTTQALNLIRREFANLQTKGFTEAEFDAVRESLIEDRKASWDSQSTRIGDAVFQNVLGFRQTLEKQLRDIRKTTPGQVQAMLKRLKPHTEYLLG
ncbi:MAG: insulinase family protein [Planctomycetes bacterium]|nr:insulinase family protein [Planctomycetota bacterium]